MKRSRKQPVRREGGEREGEKFEREEQLFKLDHHTR
jgi:hypothetical protein